VEVYAEPTIPVQSLDPDDFDAGISQTKRSR
jgi:hypothetical protein